MQESVQPALDVEGSAPEAPPHHPRTQTHPPVETRQTGSHDLASAREDQILRSYSERILKLLKDESTPETDTVILELQAFTAKILRFWYRVARERHWYDSIDEFLLDADRDRVKFFLVRTEKETLHRLYQEEVEEG